MLLKQTIIAFLSESLIIPYLIKDISLVQYYWDYTTDNLIFLSN